MKVFNNVFANKKKSSDFSFNSEKTSLGALNMYVSTDASSIQITDIIHVTINDEITMPFYFANRNGNELIYSGVIKDEQDLAFAILLLTINSSNEIEFATIFSNF